MAATTALGRVLNISTAADGIAFPLTRCGGIIFATFEAAGAAVATVTELDSTGVNSEQALAVAGANDFKAPAVGGAWTAGPGTTTATSGIYDLSDDATNDMLVIDIRADQLSDGYDSVECSVDVGILTAVMYDLTVQRLPTNLVSNLTA